MRQEKTVSEQSEDSVSQHLRLGRRLREIREKSGLTLAEVAERSGLAISTLSRAERGLLALTYDKLLKVAAGLDVHFSALFGETDGQFDRTSLAISRLGDAKVQETGNYHYEILFSDVGDKSMTPMTGVVKARSRSEFDQFNRHPGQEFLYVLSGTLVVHTESHPPVVLNAGESMYYDSMIGHVYTSSGDEDCRILVVFVAE